MATAITLGEGAAALAGGKGAGTAAIGQAENAIAKPGASFGHAATKNYKSTFFNAFPELEGKVIVHHAVEQQALKRFPGTVSESQIHSLENLRGIPRGVNSDMHLSQIRKSWNEFYRNNPSPTAEQLLQHAGEVDRQFGHLFEPPVK